MSNFANRYCHLLIKILEKNYNPTIQIIFFDPSTNRGCGVYLQTSYVKYGNCNFTVFLIFCLICILSISSPTVGQIKILQLGIVDF